jgi:hypothetical protein
MICAVRTVLQRRLAAILALVVIVGGVATLVVINVVKGLPWSVNFSAVATLIVTVIVAAVAPVRSLVARAKGTLSLGDTTLAKAREDLAKAMAAGWAEEDRLRRINDSWPLPVRWDGPLAGKFDEISQDTPACGTAGWSYWARRARGRQRSRSSWSASCSSSGVRVIRSPSCWPPRRGSTRVP